ncbi:MAG: c-type cytochrome [Planctomycetes bacterium]|nr:c-type cytochrome [Planctomycetota bacterium]
MLLGTPLLTAGIPGTGALTTDEIRAWLADPKHHVVIDPILPYGLDAGAGQEKGLATNPLTRAKIELGRQLYFDPRLSADGTVSCATCHDPKAGWAMHTKTGEGIRGQKGGRNSPASYNRILSDLQFWDGRAATLEDQAVGPIANPIEMGNTHEACVKSVAGIEGYKLQFDRIFGGVTIDAVGKALATFERAIITGPSPFDHHERWARFRDVTQAEMNDDLELAALVSEAKEGVTKNPMSASAIRGRDLYFGKANCTKCHVGPNLTDESYRNIGVGMDAKEPDLGRFVVTKVERDRGAFKTPTVRNVAETAPYMHDGSMATLEEVVEWYNKGGHPNQWLDENMKPLGLTPEEKTDLVDFMKACTGAFPPVETGRLPR